MRRSAQLIRFALVGSCRVCQGHGCCVAGCPEPKSPSAAFCTRHIVQRTTPLAPTEGNTGAVTPPNDPQREAAGGPDHDDAGMHVLYSSNAGGYVPDRAGGAHQGGEDANYATPANDSDGDGLYDGVATHPDEHAEGGPPGRSSLGGNAPTRRRHVCLRARVFVHSQ